MNKNIKDFIYIGVFLLIFLIFLIFLPTIFLKNENFDMNQEKILLTTNPSDYLEKVKYETIAKSITFVFDNISVQESNYKTLQHLLITNQISNRENSLGQEVLSLYLKNKTLHSTEVTKEIIDYILDQYDTEQQRKWRNHEFILYYNKTPLFTLYNSSHLIKNFNNSTIFAKNSINISIYSHQLYIFEFLNQTIKKVLIDLNSNQSHFDLLKDFFDEDTNLPKSEIKNFNSTFIKSNKIYQIEFKIWK